MKLSVKNLKGQVFQVDAQPTDTIQILKNKIQETKGMAADSLKIVYKGKTVTNQDTIQKLGIKQSDFIVVMAQVQKPAPKPKEETKQQAPKQPIKQQSKKQESKKQEKQVKNNTTTNNSSNQAQINQLMGMGFPRQQCVQALRAAFNNVQRAVQYLINGIPTNLRNLPAQNQQQQQPQQAQQGGQELGVNHLRALFNSPNFAQIRNLIRQNPAAIQPILAQIAQTSPQIYNLIAQHPQEFQQIILGQQGQGGQGQGGQGLPPQPPPGSIMISPADQQAINRLRALGFSKLQSAQAYFACDKNEQLAANLLFDRLANGDIQMQPQIPGGNQGGQGGQGGSGNNQGGNNNNNQDDDNLFN